MIVGIDAHMLGDHSGGNESYYTNILKEMVPPENDKYILFVSQEADTSGFEDRFQIVRFKSSSAASRNFIELNNLCKEYHIDVLHTQYFIPFIRSCKVVCTIHDICFEHYSDIFTRKEYLRQKLLIPYAAKKSEFIFTVSENAKKDITDHYGIDPERVIVTYNAVNSQFRVLESDEINEKDLREKFGIGGEKYILSVGNLQPRKNLPRLISAYNQWKQETKNTAKLVIVGKKAWLYSDVLKAVGVDNQEIILTDYVSTEDLIRLYNAADCFLYPSFFEGFGIPPLEAMACGTAVGVAKATSLPEVVGDAGIYFDPFSTEEIKDTINRLLTDCALKDQLVQKGLLRVKKFSWKESAKKIVDVYQSMRE